MQLGHVCVVGLSAAGLSAAETLRAEGFTGRLTLIGAEPRLPYDRPPLSKQLLAGELAPEQIRLRPEGDYSDLDVELILGTAASALRPAERTVSLADGRELTYDGLIIATGLRPRRLPGADALAAAYVLRTVDDALALRKELLGAQRIAVIGAGFLGTEIAATARRMGLEVTLIDPAPAPLAPQLGREIGALIRRLHTAHGVTVLPGVGVRRILASGAQRAAGVLLDDGTVVPADVIVTAIGSIPNTAWLADSGLPLGDGVLCDEYCRAAPGVFAAGDIAAWIDPRTGRHHRVEHRMHATEHGAAAAHNLLHEHDTTTDPGNGTSNGMTPFIPVPYTWTDQYDVKLQILGTPTPQADVVLESGDITDGTFSALYVQDEHVIAALSWNRPARLPALRRLVATNAHWTTTAATGADTTTNAPRELATIH
jgi:NADPH-dependent 2,4-dienoyl-CoA reductase/sulfur reductase-like enzyme